MATAQTMITRAMRLARVIGKGETPDADESADGLQALNAMLDSWSTERLFVYYIVEESLSLVATQATYTMGSGGDLNTTRPTRIDPSSYVLYNGNLSIPLNVIDADAWAGIVAKTVTSNLPMYLFPDMQYPLVRLNFYPVPSASSTAMIRSWKQLQQFAALTDALSLPPGSQRAIEFSLAEEFGPEFGVEVPPKVVSTAMKARKNLKRINAVTPIMQTEAGVMNRTRVSAGIYTGP